MPNVRRRSSLLVIVSLLGIAVSGSLASSPGTQEAATAAPAASASAKVTRGPSSIQTLSWLAGCWESRSGDMLIEEHWMGPRGGVMLGMGRTTKGDTVREFEATRIEEKEGLLVFTAKPSGQAEASFASKEVSSEGVVFENLAHDFPQRVIYRRGADGSLAARVEGMRGGVLKGIDYPMRRADCTSGAGSGTAR